MRDHAPITVDQFNGLFDRGTDDAVPRDHFSICSNIQFFEREAQSRFGTSLNFTNVTNIKRTKLYKRAGEATRVLILDSSGNLYDSTAAPPILTVAGMTDFKMQVFFGRAYITPIDLANERGVSGSFVYVYDGTGSARKAAGISPSGTLNAANSVSSGNVETGIHLFAVAFETQSGFITKPGPAIYAALDCPGGFKVDLSTVPLGPAGTVKRHILATQSILVYDGNQNGQEFFFVPNGIINDNTTTTITVDFFDADLYSSAEYLFDQLEEIGAGADICEYKGRLVVSNLNYLYVSKVGEPESIDSLTGLVLVGPGESSNILSCVEHREILYIHKKTRAFTTFDNGGFPSTWISPALDKGTGAGLHGTISILDAQGVSVDKFLVASPKGLILFNGYYQEPELSWKINEVWKRINKLYFNLVHGINDTTNHRVYIAVPLDAATTCSHILYADYSNGLDVASIRWSVWDSVSWTPISILIDLSQDSPYLRIGSTSGIYDVSSATRLDEDQAITFQVRFSPISIRSGYLNHYAAIRLRVVGSGILESKLYSEDNTLSASLANTTLGLTPGKEYTRLANFINEKCAVDLRTVDANAYFNLNRLDLFGKVLWSGRPI